MDKFVIFAFNGNQMCFLHVLLNAIDMENRGMESKIVIEGEAVKLVVEMEESKNPLYLEAKQKGIIAGICKACSAKLGVLAYNQNAGLPLLDDMSGHPSIAAYIAQGYQVITM